MRMKINVLFFASVREMVGINAKEVDIQDSENSPHKLLNFLIKSSLFVNIIPPLGPLKTLCVVDVTTSANLVGFG